MLRITPNVISDGEIFSLCAMLDVENSGTVGINEIIAFVGAEPDDMKQNGRAQMSTTLEPIKTIGFVRSTPSTCSSARSRNEQLGSPQNLSYDRLSRQSPN